MELTRSWPSIKADGCAGPHLRQAKQREHLGREKKGTRPQGEGSKEEEMMCFGGGRVASVPMGFQGPMAG